jgi:hypothetical protein
LFSTISKSHTHALTPSPPAPRRVGFAAYLWSLPEQDRLLVETLGPLVDGLRRDGLVDHFHFDRFDTRGRHLHGFVTTTEAHREAVRERLDTALRTHLATVSTVSPVSREERQRCHDECRGTVACPADELPGLADEGSHVVFEQDTDRISLGWVRRLDEDDGAELTDLLDDLDGWLLGRIRAVPHARRTATSVLWVAAVDHALGRHGADAAGYWRFHASTLLRKLEESLAKDPERVLAALPELVGEANRRTFEALWDRALEAGAAWPGLDRLVELARREAAAAPAPRWALLREIDHTVLRQLGLLVKLHQPVILHAWLRNL